MACLRVKNFIVASLNADITSRQAGYWANVRYLFSNSEYPVPRVSEGAPKPLLRNKNSNARCPRSAAGLTEPVSNLTSQSSALGPAWSPLLPLSATERLEMFLSDDGALHLVALYSISLHERDYDFLGHPLTITPEP